MGPRDITPPLFSSFDYEECYQLQPICEFLGIDFNDEIARLKADKWFDSILELRIPGKWDSQFKEPVYVLKIEWLAGWIPSLPHFYGEMAVDDRFIKKIKALQRELFDWITFDETI